MEPLTLLALAAPIVLLGALVDQGWRRYQARRAEELAALIGEDDGDIVVRVGRKPHRIRGRHAPGERRDDPWYCFGAASLRPPIPADLRIELVDGEVSATALHRDPRDVRQLAVWTLDEAGARRLIADADRVLRLRQLLDGSVFTGSVVDGEAAAFHREPNEDDAMVQVLVRSNAADIVRLLHEVW